MPGFQTAFLSVKFLTHADSLNVRRTGAHSPSEHSSHGHKFTPELNLSSKVPFVLPDKARGLHSAVELHQDHTHNPKSAKAFLPPRAVSWLQRDQKQEPAVFSYHHCDSRNLHSYSWGSRWQCPTKQQAYLCRRCRFPRSPAGRYSCVPGWYWCRWRFCHSCAVRCHSRHALRGVERTRDMSLQEEPLDWLQKCAGTQQQEQR